MLTKTPFWAAQEALRVGVSAAPERGKANDALIAVIAQALHCKASQITIVAGETSRDKRVLILGLTPELLQKRIDELDPARAATAAPEDDRGSVDPNST